MIGIYKITNNINQHCYIGQSRNIQKRWNNHKIAVYNKNDRGYDYPLYRAIRKYGLQNFSFEIIEECSIEELNNKEYYYIQLLSPFYNQTEGGDYQVVAKKLSYEQVKEIQTILIQDINGTVSHKKLAEKYNVHKDTIRDINVGRTWFNKDFSYPLHISRHDPRTKHPKTKKTHVIEQQIDRATLKYKIRNQSFESIAKEYHKTSGNAIKKWCDYYNLPRLKSEIKKYTDEEWELV